MERHDSGWEQSEKKKELAAAQVLDAIGPELGLSFGASRL